MEQKIRRDRNMGSNLRRLRDQYGISQENSVPNYSEEAATSGELPMPNMSQGS